MGTDETMAGTKRLVTARELERMPEDDFRYELVDGRLIRMSPTGGLHGLVTAGLLVRLSQHATAYRLGVAVTEVGFILSTDPDTVRAPDVAFVRRERIPASGVPRGFWMGPPDLAVEVVSPDDRLGEIAAKVDEYLSSGVALVWVVDADHHTVTVHSDRASTVTLGEEETLDAAAVLPGFTCPVSEIFAGVQGFGLSRKRS
jgi:Uma2 family endonuclease